MIVRAILIKLITEDGLVEMRTGVSVGRVYNVDLNTRRIIKGYNFVKEKEWEREIINDADYGGWIATELLRIEG